MFIKLFSLMLLVSLVVSCGRKLPPVPPETLGIPVPDWMEIYYDGQQIVLSNPSEYDIYVERASTSFGDFGFPYFRFFTNLPPNSSFTDNAAKIGESFLYRFSTYNKQYDAYSEPYTRTISYHGPIFFESIQTKIQDKLLCVNYTLSQNAVRAEIAINGQIQKAEPSGCYSFPFVSKLLVVLVPFSDSGLTGQAYSETIDLTKLILLPPQNLKIVRSGNIITLSFDRVQEASAYNVQTQNKTITLSSGETIFRTSTNIGECVDFTLYTLKGKEVSPPLTAKSCP